jgi:Cys-Gly metallodipeptidase DUG1
MSLIPQAVPDYIERNADKFIKRLSDAVSIPSISGDAAYRKYVFQMADWIEQEMKSLGIETKQVPVGTQMLDGQELVLPNVVLGTLGNDKNKKTVLLYGHFDVQPVRPSIFQYLHSFRLHSIRP